MGNRKYKNEPHKAPIHYLINVFNLSLLGKVHFPTLQPEKCIWFLFFGLNAKFEPKTRKSWLDKTDAYPLVYVSIWTASFDAASPLFPPPPGGGGGGGVFSKKKKTFFFLLHFFS